MPPARPLLLVGTTLTALALLGACSNSSPSSGNSEQVQNVEASDGGTCAIPPVAITHGTETAGAPTVHLLSSALYPDAVCNDGTQAPYIFRPGVGEGASRWVIYLEGGGFCSNDADCQDRYTQTPTYMTSSNFTEGEAYRPALEGIKSADPAVNPDFYDANYVQLVYCSSDIWSGDVAGDPTLPTSSAGRWAYRGREIVRAALADLATKGLAQATEVLLVGSSAGGIGTLQRADDVGEAVAPARFVALMDAGFFLDFPSYDPETMLASTMSPTERRSELDDGVALWGGGGDTSCEAAATTTEAHQLCRGAQPLFAGQWVTSHMLIRQSEYDNVQLASLDIVSTDKSGPVKAYRAQFSAELVAEMTPFAASETIFATDDTEHGVVNDDSQWAGSTVGGISLPAMVGSWYRDPCHATSLLATP